MLPRRFYSISNPRISLFLATMPRHGLSLRAVCIPWNAGAIFTCILGIEENGTLMPVAKCPARLKGKVNYSRFWKKIERSKVVEWGAFILQGCLHLICYVLL